MTIRIGRDGACMPDTRPPVAPMAAARALKDGRIRFQTAAPVGIELVEIKKSSGARELVATVDRDRVVQLRGSKSVIPGRVGIVKIRPGILGHIQAAPPQIHVQLIRMGWAGDELRRP